MRALLLSLALLAGPLRAQEVPDPEALVALLRAQKYDELDARVGAWQAAYEAASDAEWPLVIALRAFDRIDADLEPLHAAWIKAKPNSYVARVALAAYWHQRAWSARGRKYVSDTPQQKMTAMDSFFQRSDAELKASLALSPRPQLSHCYLIVSGMARGGSKQVEEATVAALRADPESYCSRRAFLNALREEWGGSAEAMQKFVDFTKSQPQTPKLAAVTRKLAASMLGYRALQMERKKDAAAALDLYGQGLAEVEDAVLLQNRGRLLMELKRYDEAQRDFDRAVALDPTSGDAWQRRGTLYDLRKQPKETLRDYSRAGSFGRIDAAARAGIMYLRGSGTPLNYNEARRYLGLGAEFGDADAQMALGYMYSAALGGPQEPRKAYDLWRLSAAQGNKQAQEYLNDVPWWWKARFWFEDLVR